MRFLDEYRKKRNKLHVKNKIIENMNVDMFLMQEENGEIQKIHTQIIYKKLSSR